MTERTKVGYKRLPGRGPRKMRLFPMGLSRCRLYLGADHVLAVENLRFSEDYKRYYFRDIQAIVTQRDRRLAVSAAIQAALLVAFFFLGLGAGSEPVRVFWWCVAFVSLVALVVNSLKGPTCTCRVMTAVQEDMLPSLNRVRVARRVIDGTLRPIIEEAQGSVRPEEVAEAFAAGVATRWKDEPLGTPLWAQKSKGHTGYRGGAHVLAFCLFIAGAVMTGMNLLHHFLAFSIMANLIGWAAVVCLVVGLAKQRGSLLPHRVRRIAWVTFVFVCVYYALGSASGMALVMRAPATPADQFEVYRSMFDWPAIGSPFVMAILIFNTVAGLVLGTLGLVLTLLGRPPKVVEGGPLPAAVEMVDNA